eukprot:3574371-Heterocapsa_arctica.AAC.1
MEREGAGGTKQREFVGRCKDLRTHKEKQSHKARQTTPRYKRRVGGTPSAIMWYAQISRLAKLHTRVKRHPVRQTSFIKLTQTYRRAHFQY